MSAAKRVIVAIDIGLTRTAVAIGTIHDTPNGEKGVIDLLQNWPGSNELLNKVPTKLAYLAGKEKPCSWGSACPQLGDIEPGMAIKDMFKFYLDISFREEKFQRFPEKKPAPEDVKWWYGHFLTALYHEIMHDLRGRVANLQATYVEFVFSIPTEWKDKDLLMRTFRDLVDGAGFGNIIIMELTEGEAAAVFTAYRVQYSFQDGESFMVCDAGGGTTDMCVLRVKRTQDVIELENLDDPKGLPIGSVNIDDMAEVRIASLLGSIREIPSRDIASLALQITQGEFQRMKENFGGELFRGLQDFRLKIPGLSRDIRLQTAELEEMFEAQVKPIIEGIDKQVSLLKQKEPLVRLRYLFLAGGLGSSKYVQSRIVEYLKDKDMKVLFAPDPGDLPLAVSKGLVIDRFQNFSRLLPVIPIRSSSSSYGILFKEIYGERHSGQRAIRDPLDGKKYAENQIDWLIRKDSNHRRDEVVNRSYSVLIDPNSAIQGWSFSVVRSTLDTMDLPDYLDGKHNVEVVCHVSSRPEAERREMGITQKRGIIGNRTVFRRVPIKLSAKISVGKFVFTNKVIGPWDSIPQDLIVHWPKGEAVICCDLIRNAF